MRVALLSCGPSLADYPGPDGFGLVIGVNKAATAHRCHWWSVGDEACYWRYQPVVKGLPLTWTAKDTAERIGQHTGLFTGRTYQRDERVQWTLFSATAALWLACSLGTEVVCYGCDMAGELNWDGTAEVGAVRTPSRWERERAAWDNLIENRATVKVTHGSTHLA